MRDHYLLRFVERKLLPARRQKQKVAAPTGAGTSSLQQWASLGPLLPTVQKRLEEVKRQRIAERFWGKDPTLWTSDEEVARDILDRLGWLSVIESMQEDCSFLRSFAAEVRHAGFTHALLLGMGGSSLCTYVCRQTFGVAPGFLDLAVLDSTVPAAVREAERRSPLDRTLFLVATKSGTTTETLCFFRYFFEKVRQRKGARAGEPTWGSCAWTIPTFWRSSTPSGIRTS